MSTKKCSKCKTSKGTHEFGNRSASKDGLTAKCSLCLSAKAIQNRSTKSDKKRGYNLKSRFDISIEDYNVIFLKQGGKCAICIKSESSKDKEGKIKWLSTDHNHKTGKIRGLLCYSCNTGLGKLGDSVKTLRSAIKYLNKRGSYG